MQQNAEILTREFYTTCSQRLSSHPVIAAFADPKLEWILSKVDLHGKKVLEVGAGNGYFSARLDPLCDLTVLDLSDHQLECNPAKTKVTGSVYDIPFPDQSFDIVFCSNLLHHLDEPGKAVQEMARVARNDVIISEPNSHSPLIFLGAMFIRHEHNAIHYTRAFVKKLIDGASLNVTDYTYLGGFVMPNATPEILLPLAGARSRSPLSFFQIFICHKN